MKETKTIKTPHKHKLQETSDDEMGIEPPHISDEEMRRLFAEARQQEGRHMSREEMKKFIRS